MTTGSWSAGPCAWSILVHGGAGDVAVHRRPSHVAGCERAAAAGAAVLAGGGSALDAVTCAVQVLEDDPLFNAGTGACLTADGTIELDASIMDGHDLRAGAVCALPPFQNPILIARAVMEKTRHVLLAGDGAARFAVANGFVPADPASMITQDARDRLAAVHAARSTRARTDPNASGGTVGAVARDARGRLAAATSTGGMVDQLAGRVGDSPIVGAGNYADEVAACSTTGHGESMMRVCLAKSIADAVRSSAPHDAVRAMLERMLARTTGTGGAIVASRDGGLALARTTPTMSWAAVAEGAAASGS